MVGFETGFCKKTAEFKGKRKKIFFKNMFF
jgi:hypothetical protein